MDEQRRDFYVFFITFNLFVFILFSRYSMKKFMIVTHVVFTKSKKNEVILTKGENYEKS